MRPALSATIKAEGANYVLAFPYDEECREELKDAITKTDVPEIRNWKDIQWQGASRTWLITAPHLDTARTILNRYATERGWTFEDYTARSEEAIQADQRAATQQRIREHKEAFLAVIPQLPRRSLKLVNWTTGTLELELTQYLGAELFGQLAAASLDSRRETLLMPGDKRGFGHKFKIAALPSLIAALQPLDVQYLTFHGNLDVTEAFDDDVILHLVDAQERVWLGARIDRVRMSDWSEGHDSWPITIVNGKLYVVFEREAYINRALRTDYHAIMGRVFVPQQGPVSGLLQLFRSEEWFVRWAMMQMGVEFLRTRYTTDHGPYWQAYQWQHPGEIVTSYLLRDNADARRLLEMLSLTRDDVERYKAHFDYLASERAAQARAEAHTEAAALARPRFEELTKPKLLDLATRFEVRVAKSANKPQIIDSLAAVPVACEEIIGLTAVETKLQKEA